VLPAIFMLPAVALVLWIWRSTRYVVTDTSLLVTCGVGKVTVPLADITSVRRTATVLSAPALSLDRLEVQHAGGAVVISPADRERFVAALTARNPRVNVDEMHARTPAAEAQYRKHGRTMALFLASVVTIVFGLVLALSFYELSPPHVAVDGNGIVVVSGSTRMAVTPREITSVALVETLPPVQKRFGWNSYTSLRGRFNTDRASGWVHVSRQRPPFIVLETADSFLILNDTDPEKTRATYAAISQRWRMARQ
jgi:hypothetical protein